MKETSPANTLVNALNTSNFLPCGKPDLGRDEAHAVLNVLRSGWLGNGPITSQFENEFKEFIGISNAVAVNSATIGLVIALRASAVGSGDEVITTPLTFAATVNAILMVGAKPVFVDVDPLGSINHREIGFKITKKTKAILPVHLWGIPCEMETINVIAHHHGLKVIEDASHAFGGTYAGQSLGTLGDMGVFSFYPTKNLASCDGGMIVTRDSQMADLMRVLASQGVDIGAWERNAQDYEVIVDGYKGLMNDLTASIALAQLKRWGILKYNRSKVFKIYESAFGKKGEGHSQHIYEIRVKNRSEFRRKLYKEGIGTGVHYNPLHLEPAYSFLGYKKGEFTLAEKIGRETMTLPLSSTMSEEDAERVVEAVKKIKGEIE